MARTERVGADYRLYNLLAMATQGRASTTTILFTDLVGSTELLQRLGDDEADPLRRAHFRLLRESIAAHGGQEVKNIGDSLMVVFTSAFDAVASAVAVQQAVHRHNEQQEEARRLQVRIGLNAGEPIRDQEDYFGTPVVIARRLCDDAKGGEIIASALVRGLVGSRGTFAFRELGQQTLKGIAQPVSACEVLWEPIEDEQPSPAPIVEERLEPLPLPPLLDRRRTAFVGREAEIEALRRRWDGGWGGEGRLVLVSGEPGIGKTRLAGEFARGLHAEGVTVLYGRCDEEAVIRYQPFAEALGHYAAHCPPDTLRRQLAGSGAEIVRLLPELSERIGPPHPARGDPESERYRFFEAVRSILAEAGRSRPMLLVLDDLHWADKPTLLLLKHIVRAPEESPLLILGTYRETDLARNHPLAEALADLRRERAFERLILKGLDEAGVGALMASRAGHEAAPAFVRVIHDQTDGNPFFIEEVLASLVESGALYQSEGRWVSDATSADEMGIPEGVREVVGRRLSRLSDGCNSILANAAVLGREFDFTLLARMIGMEEEALLPGVEEALAAQVIIEVRGRTSPTYAFGHVLVRQTLYAELSLPRKQRLHLRAAEVIEDAHARAIEPQLAALAAHYRLAGAAAPTQKALEYSLRAGEHARALFAYEDAIAHWGSALELMQETSMEPVRRARLLEGLGDLMYLTGTSETQGIGFLEDALQLYEQAGEVERAARAHSRLGRHLSTYGGSEAEDIPRALEHFRAAEAVLAKGPKEAALGFVYVGLANALMRALRVQESLNASLNALDIAEATGNQLLGGFAMLIRGWALAEAAALAAGTALVERAWQTADRLNHAVLAFLTSWNRGNLAMDLSDPLSAEMWYGRELSLARLAQATGSRETLLGNVAGARVLAGHMDDVGALANDYGITPRMAEFFGGSNWEQMCQTITLSRERSHRNGDYWAVLRESQPLARTLRALSRQAEGKPMLMNDLPFALDGGFVVLEIRIRIELSLMFADTSCAQDAHEHLARCREVLAAGEDWRGLGGRFARAEGAVTAALGRLDEAERQFIRAIDIFRRYTLPWDEAEALHGLGRALLAAGEQDRGNERLNAAIDIYRRHGAGQRWIDFVEREKATA